MKKEEDIKGIRLAGRLVQDTLDMIESKIRAGISTDAINTWVHEFTIRNVAIPAPLTYNNFPKSCCISVNEVVCHGVPDDRILEDGDIVNVDVTSIVRGYYADANKTFFVGIPGPEAVKIVETACECLQRSVAVIKPGKTIGDIGQAIQNYAETQGCSVVRDFVGHGTGFAFHEPPIVPHFGEQGTGIPLVPGMVFTVEPMINLGGKEISILEDNWTVVTRDGSLSAQFEQTLLVTETGVESLTPF
uniref:type I methionyl aminopeptidase n=1 Tax=Candidatus Electrothrix sp. TaxID=2170559 RepID=UPI0040563566